MQTEKQRERLVELLKKSGASFERVLPEEIADFLLENRVIIDTGEQTKKRLLELFNFAKYLNCERVELQKDEYLYLFEYMEKAEKVLKERKENGK